VVLLVNFIHAHNTFYHKCTAFKLNSRLSRPSSAETRRTDIKKYYEIKSYLWLRVQLHIRNITSAKI